MVSKMSQSAARGKLLPRLVLFLALALAVVLAAPSMARADAYTTRTGNITVMRLLTSAVQKAGEEADYKLTVNKSGQLTAVLTDVASGEKITLLDRGVNANTSIKLVVPGEKLADNRVYTVSVKLARGGEVVGTAEGRLSTKPVVAKVNTLTATASFNPVDGGACTVSFSLADPGNLYAQVLDGAGKVVATLANNMAVSGTSGTLTWSGATDQKGMAENGEYTVRAWVVNTAGTSPVATAHTRLNGTAVAVTGQTQGALVAAFIRNKPMEGTQVNLTLNASTAGNYILKLRDSNTGRSIKRTGALHSGANSILLDEGGFIVGGHSYVCQVLMTVNGKTAGKAALTFSGHVDPPTLSAFTIGSFQPGYGMSMPLNFTQQGSGQVHVNIYDAGGKLVAAALSGASYGSGSHTAYWNGRGLNGTFLPAGKYTITCDVKNIAGTSKTLSQSFDYAPIEEGLPAVGVYGSIKTCTLLSNPKSAERTPARIYINVAEAGTLKIAVREVNTGAKAMVYNQRIEAGGSNVTIPGSYLSGGKYSVEVNLLNLRGKCTGKARLALNPQILPPGITNFTMPSTLSSGNGAVCSGTLTMRTCGVLLVNVRDSSGALVRSLYKSVYSYAGNITVSWDGRRTNYSLAPSGEYTISASYVDDRGVSSNVASQKVTVTKVAEEKSYGKVYVGIGEYNTRIRVYDQPHGGQKGSTYANSGVIKILKDDGGEYVYAEVSVMNGKPIVGYVLRSQIQEVTIYSPYRIEVSISRTGGDRQSFKLYKDGKLIDWFHVSTGAVDKTTPTGTYLIMDRMPYFYAGGMRCEHALRVVGGVCIHRVPEWKNSYDTTSRMLGSPASHGCIRVPVNKSEWLYKNIPDTTPVYIYYG